MAGATPEGLVAILTDVVGRATAEAIIADAMAGCLKERELSERIASRVRQPMNDCLEIIERKFGTVDDDAKVLLDGLGPSGLAVVSRLAPTCETPRQLRDAIRLVRKSTSEGFARGAQGILRSTIEYRYGGQPLSWLLAIETADAQLLKNCLNRVHDATTAREALEPILRKHDL